MNKELKNQLNIVFDEKGELDFCGRSECIKLIELLEKENNELNFGNKKNGFLNVEEIQKFIKTLK